MRLSKSTLEAITQRIECSDIEESGWSYEHEFEVKQAPYIISVTFHVLAEFVREYNYHYEVSFPNYENMSHFDFVDAEILDIEAYNMTEQETEQVENLDEVKYYN